MLNGKWDFKYYPKFSDMPKRFDTSIVDFDEVNVPSMWQYTGYEKPYYINQNYPFGRKPPKIPTDDPCWTLQNHQKRKVDAIDCGQYL